eukprot:gnl/Chilomastix_cuspidata/3028.p1 GENE.gnl/Chilomastix_cuspidata/3028~~gnl/Chilomastix_cuspidata/3028.p1  ORF type:complete len:393 (-),score=120.82 gnl/Chilomastix_cuspidata/3028:46-1056(-)
MRFFAGVEGGGSSTTIAVLDENGKLVFHQSINEASNIWVSGLEEACSCIHNLLYTARKGLADPDAEPMFESIGFSLSGIVREEDATAFRAAFLKQAPALVRGAASVAVAEDTHGAARTLSAGPCYVLIAGSGSIAFAAAAPPRRSGGWGHALGDQGSAYYIAHRAVKAAIALADGTAHASDKRDLDAVRAAVCAHFSVRTLRDIIPHFYAHFDKGAVAGLAVCVAQLAAAGNAVCARILARAGTWLARSLSALVVQDPSSPSEIDVLCIGGVWNSFDLFKEAFRAELAPLFAAGLKTMRLFQIRDGFSAAIGATLLGAPTLTVDRRAFVAQLAALE